MHGFSEMYHSKNPIWCSLWLMIIIAAITLTTFQVYKAIDLFMAEPTVTTIRPAKEEDIFYPPLMVCYPHWMYWVNVYEASKLNFTKDGILYGLSYLTKIYSSNHFNIKEARENFILSMKYNNITRIRDFYSAISYPAWQLLMNTGDNVSTEVIADHEQNDVKLCHVINGANIKKLIEEASFSTIKNKMKSSNTNLLGIPIFTKPIDENIVDNNEYVKYVATWLDSPQSADSSNIKDLNAYSFPTMVYPNKYSKDGVAVTKDNDYITITMKLSVNIWKSSSVLPCHPDWKWISANETCSIQCAAEKLYKNEKKITLLHAIVTNNDILSTDITMNPIEFLNNSPNMTVAPVEFHGELESHYNETIEDHTKEIESCVKKCPTGCQVYNFDISVQTGSTFRYRAVRTIKPNNCAFVTIAYPTENEVLVMTEEDLQTWEGFIGNVGGLLGIWTGASILSFIQLFYLCCCSDCDKKKQTDGETIESPSTYSSAIADKAL